MCIIQKSRQSSNVKVKGQGHRAQTKRKSAVFCSGVVLCGAVLDTHLVTHLVWPHQPEN